MRLSLLPALLLLNLGCGNGSGSVYSDGAHSVSQDPDLGTASMFASLPDADPADTGDLHLGDSLLTPPPAPRKPTTHLDTARTYIGVVEDPKDSNLGVEVEKFLASVGLAPYEDGDGNLRSYPYCAAFVSYCLDQAEGVRLPVVRSAGARMFITNKSIRANVVQRGTVHIEPGTIVIWKAKRDPEDTSGHVGLVVEWHGQEGITVEGNTGPGDEGDQRDGGGVYERRRRLSPASAFRITDFTPVVYQ